MTQHLISHVGKVLNGTSLKFGPPQQKSLMINNEIKNNLKLQS